MASLDSGVQELEHCFTPKRGNKASFLRITSPKCRPSRDDDCSTCAPSPAFSSGYPSPSPSLPISSRFERSTARQLELFGEESLFLVSADFRSFSHFGRPEMESPLQENWPIMEEDGFQTPRITRAPSTPPGAPKKAAAPPLMKVLQANTDSADTCRALLGLLVDDPEAPRFPFFEHCMEPPLVCAAKAFCSAEVMQILIQHGADVNLRDSCGYTAADIVSKRLESMALHGAHPVKVTDQEVLKVLLEAGAARKEQPQVFDMCAPEGPMSLDDFAKWLN